MDYAANPPKTEYLNTADRQRLMNYTQNGDKTEHQLYVSGFNCDPQNAYYLMQATKQRWGKPLDSGNVGYHIIQSFKPGEATPDQVHEIGCEFAQLPAPKIELYEDSTRVVLFSEIPFSAISIENKLWACYLHACIRQVEGEQLTNSSLRERFGLKNSSAGSISRLIKEAVSMKLIKPLDSSTAPRYMKYIPIWA